MVSTTKEKNTVIFESGCFSGRTRGDFVSSIPGVFTETVPILVVTSTISRIALPFASLPLVYKLVTLAGLQQQC